MGVAGVGHGIGHAHPSDERAAEIVTGHDFRSYSAAIKYALSSGLMAAGCRVHDIGLALTPMTYFAQFDLDVPCVAMVDGLSQRQWLDRGEDGRKPAAHLRSGRNGPSQGTSCLGHTSICAAAALIGSLRTFRPVTHRRSHQPAKAQAAPQGGRGMRQRHRRCVCAACAGGDRLRGGSPRLRARPHLPALQSQPGRYENAARDPRCGACEPCRCRPRLRWRRRPLRRGRRRGGEEIFADKVGVMLARDISTLHPGATFVVDVKSTGLFVTDPVLRRNGVKADYWKTGHSYMKRRNP